MANVLQIGATTGAVLATGDELNSSGLAYYVSSETGDDGNSGLSRQDPFATVAAALSAAGTEDLVVLKSDHAETLASDLNITSQATIVGEGNVSGVPSPTITPSSQGIEVTGSDVHIYNVKFASPGSSSSGPVFDIQGSRSVIDGCYFEGDENVNGGIVNIASGAAVTTLRNTTIISTATTQDTPSNNDPPTVGLLVAAAITDLTLDGVVFSGGELGFSDYAFKATAGAITRLRGYNVSFLLGADWAVHANTTGYLHVGTKTGGVTGVWS